MPKMEKKFLGSPLGVKIFSSATEKTPVKFLCLSAAMIAQQYSLYAFLFPVNFWRLPPSPLIINEHTFIWKVHFNFPRA